MLLTYTGWVLKTWGVKQNDGRGVLDFWLDTSIDDGH